jgi:hypothetical protein
MLLGVSGNTSLFGLRAGAPLVIMGRFTTTEFARVVRTFEIRSTVLQPAAIAMLNQDPDIEDLSPLRFVRSITAPLSPLQARRFKDRFGVFVLNSWGQAEMGNVIRWIDTGDQGHRDRDQVGGGSPTIVAIAAAEGDQDPIQELEVGGVGVRDGLGCSRRSRCPHHEGHAGIERAARTEGPDTVFVEQHGRVGRLEQVAQALFRQSVADGDEDGIGQPDGHHGHDEVGTVGQPPTYAVTGRHARPL